MEPVEEFPPRDRTRPRRRMTTGQPRKATSIAWAGRRSPASPATAARIDGRFIDRLLDSGALRMFAFASAITRPDVYERCAERGIRRVAEPDSVVIAQPSVGSIFTTYNAILDRAAALDPLEALVLVHQDA